MDKKTIKYTVLKYGETVTQTKQTLLAAGSFAFLKNIEYFRDYVKHRFTFRKKTQN